MKITCLFTVLTMLVFPPLHVGNIYVDPHASIAQHNSDTLTRYIGKIDNTFNECRIIISNLDLP